MRPVQRLDDRWFVDWLMAAGGEQDALDDLLEPPRRTRQWLSCTELKLEHQRATGAVADAKTILRRLPKHVAHWVAFLMWRILRHACRFHPGFDVMLKDHLYAELLLYAETDYDRYREHIIHPYKVMALGFWLADQIPSLISRVGRHLQRREDVQALLSSLQLSDSALYDERVIRTAWWLAGLFHDIGYMFYLFSHHLEPRVLRAYPVYVGNAAGRLGTGTPEYLLSRCLSRGLWSGSDDADDSRSRARSTGFLTASGAANHSIVGGLTLLAILDEIESVYSTSPEQALAFHLAAEAICFHDLVGERKLIDCQPAERCLRFNKRPLAWLLVLCDKLQDWGRPVPQFRQVGDRTVEATFEETREWVECEISPYHGGGKFGKIALDPKTREILLNVEQRCETGLSIDWSSYLDIA